MAFGDVGGPVTELIITCTTPSSGGVSIAKGDALKLVGDYEVDNVTTAEDPVFGQALGAETGNGMAIPVKVRGVCVYGYTGTAPVADGSQGILASGTAGKVKAPLSGNGGGINVKVDAGASEVHVLV